ncbi:SUMO-specific isopeptidase USPL1 [Synchiropus splendidus]|uniref:SUMO-specific isopeptidase USPL1 n=1 Tax=Synchiropus splendidus TaxID=270530 RepID=UPI00237E6290|nr:SUMO-specific isopeptidase USPL1 [Synchiropus splendidus]XP_053704088.1 SUMO-specific isopeptidase USPL1 [Synchiropus splendidus]
MVLFHWTPLDQRRNGGLLMSAEDTGLGAFASPLVGYLGKVNERAASLELCPWCASKGLTHTLRSYRVNLKESITLCTNSDCLFPLVSRSLDDILASLVPGEPKRKLCSLQDDEEDLGNSKRIRSTDNIEETVVNHVENKEAEIDGLSSSSDTEGGKLNKFQNNAAIPQTSDGHCAPENVAGSDVLGPQHGSSKELLSSAGEDVATLSSSQDALETLEADKDPTHEEAPDELHEHVSQATSVISSTDVRSPLLLEEQQKGEITEKLPVKVRSCESETEDLSMSMVPPVDLVSAGPLFWKNRDNLCWLDSLLVVLVTCKNLNKWQGDDGPHSLVWKLKREYASICAAVGVQRLTDNGDSVKVPCHVLQKADADLHALRMSIFKMLEPQLRCKLGQRETPVFALPLLLKMDSSVEPLFQASFSWEFKCSGCKLNTRDQVTKTLPTVTNLFPDWHPLHASHSAPCNRCSLSGQRRTMVLERVPPVFALHFVEGLPQNEVSVYDFNFKGKHYTITSVIQFKQDLQHFVTWIHQSEGSWLEVDDLKSKCQSHSKLPVPAQEIHIVFWEEMREKPCVCSPTSTSASSPKSTAVDSHLPADGAESMDESHCPDQSLLLAQGNFHIDDVLATSNIDTTGADESIGSTTLMDAFEGLTRNDIITLTLDIVPHPEANEPGPGVLDETLVPAEGSVCEVSPGAETPTTTTTHTSETELVAYPPRSGPAAGTRSQRRRTPGRSAASDQELEGTAADVSTHPSPEPSEVEEIAALMSSIAEVRQSPSPVSSTQTTSPPATQTSNVDDQRLSYLFSRHPAKIGGTPPVAPGAFNQGSAKPLRHSTPVPLKRFQTVTPGGLKPKLRTEDGDHLPIRASERFSGFCAKSTASPNPPEDKTQAFCSPPLPPVTTKTPKLSSQKHNAGLPVGLSETDALRYKLLKKLKAKKKKLAKLNEMLSHQMGSSHQPDSTNLPSPHTVSSSTYEGSNCGEALSELMSPATTISNLSPDSSGFLDMYVTGQEGGAGAPAANTEPPNSSVRALQTDNFLDEFLCQAVAEQPSVMENDVLSELELFF